LRLGWQLVQVLHRLALVSSLTAFGCGGTTPIGGPDGGLEDASSAPNGGLDGGLEDAPSGPNRGPDARHEDAPNAPDPACLALCAVKSLSCFGVDTESGAGTITQSTAKGCSIHVTLVVSGTEDVTVDCASKNVCVDQGPGGCMGAPGTCYPATDLTATDFSYRLPNCIEGSLTCGVSD
jgi:hypothetical protein